VDTVHPPYVKISSGTWNWILGKLGFGKEVPLTNQELDSSALQSPWHVIEIEDGNLLVIDQGYTSAFTISFILFVPCYISFKESIMMMASLVMQF
jgi:hypothetical protein